MTDRKVFIFVMILVCLVAVQVFAMSYLGWGGRQETEVSIVWLDELDIGKAASGWGVTKRNRSIGGNELSVDGIKYDRGVGTHSAGEFNVTLNKGAIRFKAVVGIDDEMRAVDMGLRMASVEFVIIGDKKELWTSGIMRAQSSAVEVDVDVSGVDELQLLVTEGGNGNYCDHADWANAYFEVVGARPVAKEIEMPEPYILTPKPGPKPRITGPKVFGVRPGSVFLFTVTATGDRPMEFYADGLPEGLTLDSQSGRITGRLKKPGEYKVKLQAKNSLGSNERDFRIKVGDTICLTPPMGWNSWNCWAHAVDDKKIRDCAKAMVDSGLIDHGWSYVNIDDCWMVKPDSNDPLIGGEPRDGQGMLIPNKNFPDMPALTEYIHGLGLKAGIYISPGPLTCQLYVGSWEHEAQDGRLFAEWGFDYLKYDWCGYEKVSIDHSLEELQKPYKLMGDILADLDRDIVYSLCQYGWGDVWQWGQEMGGNCWRTTGDIVDSWGSMSYIGFSQDKCSAYAKPGHWNDPDMLVVGKVGWGPNLHPTRLTPDEQYTHISLWCLLSAPLLIGCDLTDMDEFTLSLLTNDEVLDVDQDPLGDQAKRIVYDGDKQIWAKDMEDGSKAVGLFNLNKYDEDTLTVTWADLGISGKHKVRDLWRHQDITVSDTDYSAKVPVHGVVLIRVIPQ